MERYLINYLKEQTNDIIVKKYTDFFKVELDWFIYNYGEHISKNYLRRKKISIKNQIHKFLKFKDLKLLNRNISNKCSHEKGVLSSLYNWSNTPIHIDAMIYTSIFQPASKKNIIRDPKTEYLLFRIREAIRSGAFNDLYNKELFYELESHQQYLINQYEQYNLRALFLFTDQYFESKYLIDIFKKLERPSMIFSHGLPGIYSKDVDHRSDYLMVWGDKIKENYINITGMNPDKIIVVGNTKYREVPQNPILRNSFENVLVIPVSSVIWHQHEWQQPQLVDRSMIVLYLYQVQHVLQSLGVKYARFRPHPSIDPEWVYGFLDKNFYKIDKLPLEQSFQKSSLVIGSTSTTFLESLMNGVNYIVYEPQDENKINMLRTHPVPPFDGSEKNLEIAKNPDELKYLLKSKYFSNPKILDGYMRPLDYCAINTILK